MDAELLSRIWPLPLRYLPVLKEYPACITWPHLSRAMQAVCQSLSIFHSYCHHEHTSWAMGRQNEPLTPCLATKVSLRRLLKLCRNLLTAPLWESSECSVFWMLPASNLFAVRNCMRLPGRYVSCEFKHNILSMHNKPTLKLGCGC